MNHTNNTESSCLRDLDVETQIMSASEELLAFDPTDEAGMRKLMDELGESKTMFPGINERGERIYISVSQESIVVVTFQKNERIRKNTYWRSGDREETFEGRARP